MTPDPNTASGYAVRSALLDIIDIFEVNRKECVRLLMEYPKWTLPGTFKAKPGAPVKAEDEDLEKDWQLESTIIEVSSSSRWQSTQVSNIVARQFWDPFFSCQSLLTSQFTT